MVVVVTVDVATLEFGFGKEKSVDEKESDGVVTILGFFKNERAGDAVSLGSLDSKENPKQDVAVTFVVVVAGFIANKLSDEVVILLFSFKVFAFFSGISDVSKK